MRVRLYGEHNGRIVSWSKPLPEGESPLLFLKEVHGRGQMVWTWVETYDGEETWPSSLAADQGILITKIADLVELGQYNPFLPEAVIFDSVDKLLLSKNRPIARSTARANFRFLHERLHLAEAPLRPTKPKTEIAQCWYAKQTGTEEGKTALSDLAMQAVRDLSRGNGS